MRTRLLATLALLALAGVARAEAWRSDPARSALTVHVLKRGLFSSFAHDHRFEVTDWGATAELDPRRPQEIAVAVRASAGSLRDQQRALSEQDRAAVNARAAGPEVLDAAHHPTIEFRSERLALAPGATDARRRGTLEGTLTLRGRTRPARITIDAEHAGSAWVVRGDARVRQSDFGIRPFSAFGGTVGVEDELRIELLLTLQREPDPDSRAARVVP